MRQPAAYRDGAVVDGLVVSPGTALEPLTPGTAGAVTETPGTPGIATLVPAGLAAPDTVVAAPGTVAVDPVTVFATPGRVAVDPGTVVATPGMAAAVPGTPVTFEVTSFAPGIIVVTSCVPGTEVAAPAAPGTAVAALPGAVGVIEDFAPSRRIFSPSFITPCARAMGAVIAKPSTAIVHAIVGRIGGSHLANLAA